MVNVKNWQLLQNIEEVTLFSLIRFQVYIVFLTYLHKCIHEQKFPLLSGVNKRVSQDPLDSDIIYMSEHPFLITYTTSVNWSTSRAETFQLQLKGLEKKSFYDLNHESKKTI